MTYGWAVLIVATWISGAPNSHQVVTAEVRSMEICEAMADQARKKFDVRGYNVKAECLEVKL